ncbi:MAG TPA: hypothetical protein VK586_24340 [Streptosporangiaceae bacterium]|nr:hypothetical protein [Streptosporangiaceae bacterium]
MITQVLAHPNAALAAPGATALGECYKQLNSSVGELGTDTLVASTKAIESPSKGDRTYLRVEAALRGLDVTRDRLALRVKGELEAAAFGGSRIPAAAGQTLACQAIIRSANRLAS